MSTEATGLVQGAAAARLVARALSDLLLTRAHGWQAMTGLNRIDCFLVQVVFSNHDFDGGPPRAVSSLSIARSMGLPYETVRRRAGALAEAGLLAAIDGGWIVPPERIEAWREAGMLRDDAAALHAATASLAAGGHEASHRAIAAGLTDAPDPRVTRGLLTFAMRSTTDFTAIYGDLISGTVAVAIVGANIRHLTENPALGRRWAAEADVPPDSERRPVSVRTLARELDLPFKTVRRRVAALRQSDQMEDIDGGVIVPARVLARDAIRDHNRLLIAQFEQMLARLTARP